MNSKILSGSVKVNWSYEKQRKWNLLKNGFFFWIVWCLPPFFVSSFVHLEFIGIMSQRESIFSGTAVLSISLLLNPQSSLPPQPYIHTSSCFFRPISCLENQKLRNPSRRIPSATRAPLFNVDNSHSVSVSSKVFIFFPLSGCVFTFRALLILIDQQLWAFLILIDGSRKLDRDNWAREELDFFPCSWMYYMEGKKWLRI